MTSPAPGDLAFVGPNHIEELSDFQYVELVEINDATATVKLAVPTEDENPSQLTLPLETFKLRAVPACERSMWPGSFVAHPIAFACTSSDGVDEWTYGVVSGYTSSEQATTLHVLLKQLDKVVMACRRRRWGIPKAIRETMSVPYVGNEVVPLIRPADLQLVRIRHQHAVDFTMAARLKRPVDLYSDTQIKPGGSKVPRPTERSTSSGQVSTQIHRPLTKRRRAERPAPSQAYSSSSSDHVDDAVYQDTRRRGVVFHPSPTDRQVHNAIVRRRHAVKEPQMLLQYAQQFQRLDFIGTPPVLGSTYHFGFGLGLSIMHLRRARTADEVATTENGVNMWDFSSKNSLPPPARATSFGDLIGALSAFYKFAKYFYNSDTRRFIAAARDFVISYADHAHPDQARTGRVVTKGLGSALRVRKQFNRNDEQLLALKESDPAWKQLSSRPITSGRPDSAPSNRSTRQQPVKTKIPADWRTVPVPTFDLTR
ncbi:hypothetical protein PHYSODRAFT_317516 [Phytophthora sojae]|uniref:Uncharacterized protein n=1 Tax=Phytophthora sojae (strain P6497) TaxID=1094619 RepID=G4ZWR5_PHYSP|nr:hypothetical protein PHYSODRAFT_317516 [Phytophthora sojae]EGZ12439.1 hypothetical protein PHYSODRAFT_317516 [Phytophthora sojae]|eukprot:XP_009532772.1 hypothetical protein PHYSODRAFT_317516 [Phytophthora sojae]